MKKIVLLGDSIRLIGYGKPVAERLSGEYEVWQPDTNCRFAKHTLRGLWDWREEITGADVIHWNNGLWDVCDLFGDGAFTSLDEYVDNMLRLARLLKQSARTVIFATTTPVRNDNCHNNNQRIAEYNATLVPLLREMGVVINDLYAPFIKDVNKYISDDKIHLSADGIAVATEIVESVIRCEAEKLTNHKRECERTSVASDGAPV